MQVCPARAGVCIRPVVTRGLFCAVALALTLAGCGDPYEPPVLEGIRLESGDQQTGIAGGPLAQPLAVRAFNQDGEPIAGARVQFSAPSGGFDQAVRFSGADGLAQAIYTLGATPGPVTIAASTKAGEVVVNFTAFSELGAATTLRAISGNQQTAVAGAPLPAPLRVRVTNQYGVGVPDVTLQWTPQAQGEVSEQSNVTDATGHAQVTFTLGGEPGAQSVTVTTDGLTPVTFTATATSPAPEG